MASKLIWAFRVTTKPPLASVMKILIVTSQQHLPGSWLLLLSHAFFSLNFPATACNVPPSSLAIPPQPRLLAFPLLNAVISEGRVMEPLLLSICISFPIYFFSQKLYIASVHPCFQIYISSSDLSSSRLICSITYLVSPLRCHTGISNWAYHNPSSRKSIYFSFSLPHRSK